MLVACCTNKASSPLHSERHSVHWSVDLTCWPNCGSAGRSREELGLVANAVHAINKTCENKYQVQSGKTRVVVPAELERVALSKHGHAKDLYVVVA